MLNVFRAAYGKYWQVLALLMSSASLLNILDHFLSLDRSSFFWYCLSLYREMFHSIIDAFLFFLPFKLPGILKDVLTTYTLLGATIVKSIDFLYMKRHKYQFEMSKRHLVDLTTIIFSFVRDMIRWPWLVGRLFARPHVYYENDPIDDYYLSDTKYPDIPRTIWYEYDVRLIFLLQLIALIAVTIAMAALNSL